MQVMTLHRAGMLFTTAVAAWVQMGAGPVRIDTPVPGQVIDVDTKAPIEGAAVRLQHWAGCPQFHVTKTHPKTTCSFRKKSRLHSEYLSSTFGEQLIMRRERAPS